MLEVKNGPSKATFAENRDCRLFLVRNAMCGSDFLRRRELLWKRGEREEREARAKQRETSSNGRSTRR